jgi:3-oxoacyl-[acyl-carrier protein] reductase
MNAWIVTGASRGLGKHLALQLAASGRKVIAMARNVQELQALAVQGPNGLIEALPIDLSSSQSISQVFNQLQERGTQIDGLINNAGIGTYKAFTEQSQQEISDTMQVNLLAVMQICHAVLPGMQTRKSGHIVNIGSDLGRRPLANMAPYVASKHGLTGFTHSILREAKTHGVKVSLINPGIIDTAFGGAQEGSKEESWSLKPEVLAKLIVQLIEQPGSTLVDELSVHPLGQGEF